MVVVSDDVHEYAVALKDTEEKIARCPSRVSTAAHKSVEHYLGVMMQAFIYFCTI